MTIHFGDVAANSTLYIPFASYDSTGASVTLTGLAVTDIEIYKDGSATQRASDNGYTLLDTDGIDFDGITGIHGFSVDLSDNSDSGFYAIGSTYWVVVSSVTIDSQTVNFIAATFTIAPIIRGAAEAGTLSTTQMTTDLTEATDDHYIGRTVIWRTGVLAGQASDITDYLGSTGMLTYSTVTDAPSAGDVFEIV